jgi:putative hydrolase of the HAD superfamily
MPLPRFEACLFDYGNTVVEFDRPQTRRLLAGLVEAFGARLGPVALDDLRRAFDRVYALPYAGDPPSYRELQPAEQMDFVLREAWDGRVEPTSDLVRECDAVLQALFVDSIAIEPEARDLLRELQGSLRVGLVSNYPCGKAIRRSLEKEGIASFFDPVVVSGEIGFVKPHPSLFARALEALGVPPERVLFVGDRLDADVLGAARAGMRTCHHVGFTSDRSWEGGDVPCRPDYRITRLAELKGILLT